MKFTLSKTANPTQKNPPFFLNTLFPSLHLILADKQKSFFRMIGQSCINRTESDANVLIYFWFLNIKRGLANDFYSLSSIKDKICNIPVKWIEMKLNELTGILNMRKDMSLLFSPHECSLIILRIKIKVKYK
ncbi:hypothetical protein JW835_15230 [bacterium]|nr:hypothetical protein [bacterium]